MARQWRLPAGGVAHHVIQRGNNRKPIFFVDNDRLLYLNWLVAAMSGQGALPHACVPMTSHVHLLLTVEREQSLPRIFQSLGRRYVAHINTACRRTGTLREGRCRSTVPDSEGYVIACHRHIEANPLRARMVAKAADFSWSGYRHNAPGHAGPLLTDHPVWCAPGATAEARRVAYRKLRSLPARICSRRPVHYGPNSLR